MKYLLGVDFGGGSSKATLLRTDGVVICENSVEYPTLYPEPQACEQNPADWLDALCRNITALLKKSGIDAGEIVGIALDSATHTSLVCDEHFRPLRPSMHWTDSRSRQQSEWLREHYGEEVFAKTFHRPDTIWTLPQLLWLREQEPETFAEIRYLFFEKDFIRYFLTGIYCTDYIEAEGSMLFDCVRMQWDEELCRIAGLTPDMLPPVLKPTDLAGTVTEQAALATGLVAGTPVICGTTDTVMEIFASGAVEKGDMTVKLATAGRICVITDKPCPDRHLVNYSHVIDGLWYPGTATKAAAASYRWYRDTFGGSYAELDKDAAKIAIGCDGLRFHPYLNGELTPYADPGLCGSFTGVRATHSRAHFTRAVLEGVAFSLLDCKHYLDYLQISYGKNAVLIGGGAKGALWQQIVADVLGICLKTRQNSDSSLGSAMLAGMALGIFSDAKHAIRICVKEKETILPVSEHTERYQSLFREYKEIHDALEPIYRERLL